MNGSSNKPSTSIREFTDKAAIALLKISAALLPVTMLVSGILTVIYGRDTTSLEDSGLLLNFMAGAFLGLFAYLVGIISLALFGGLLLIPFGGTIIAAVYAVKGLKGMSKKVVIGLGSLVVLGLVAVLAVNQRDLGIGRRFGLNVKTARDAQRETTARRRELMRLPQLPAHVKNELDKVENTRLQLIRIRTKIAGYALPQVIQQKKAINKRYPEYRALDQETLLKEGKIDAAKAMSKLDELNGDFDSFKGWVNFPEGQRRDDAIWKYDFPDVYVSFDGKLHHARYDSFARHATKSDMELLQEYDNDYINQLKVYQRVKKTYDKK
jgi:hypothetical protein